MANKSTITYNNKVISELEESGNVAVTYNGKTLDTLGAGSSKTLNCANKVMATNLTIGSKVLNCINKIMASNIVINVISLFPSTPSSYSLIGTYTSSQTWTAPEDGYFQIELQGASGNGGSPGKTQYTWGTESHWQLGDISTVEVKAVSGGGGGGGGCAISRVKMKKGDKVVFSRGNVGYTSTATITSSLETYNKMQVTSGGNGTGATGSSYSSLTPGTGGAGGVGSGGNYANYTGDEGYGDEDTDWDYWIVGHYGGVAEANGYGGSAGYGDGNEGGEGASAYIEFYEDSGKNTSVGTAGSGSPGFMKIYRGNTNLDGGNTDSGEEENSNPVFYIKGLNNVTHEYQFESGMDFGEFINSSYNDGKFSIGTANVQWNIANGTVNESVKYNDAAVITEIFDPTVINLDIHIIYQNDENAQVVLNRTIVANKTYYCAPTS